VSCRWSVPRYVSFDAHSKCVFPLHSEFHNYPGALPHFSNMISEQINAVKDNVMAYLQDLPVDKLLKLVPIFEEHLPETLLRLARDRITTRVPRPYLINAIASRVASQLVYSEGSVFVGTMPKDRMGEMALSYHQARSRVRALVAKFEKGTLTAEEKVIVQDMLQKGGVRAMMNRVAASK
jgi:hypothetical protein